MGKKIWDFRNFYKSSGNHTGTQSFFDYFMFVLTEVTVVELDIQSLAVITNPWWKKGKLRPNPFDKDGNECSPLGRD